MISMSLHQFEIVDGIKKELCLKFIETYFRLAEESPYHSEFEQERISYKQLMPAMHIGRERFQRLLNSISRNRIYIKLELGYEIIGSNISSGVDWSRRFKLYGEPVYHFCIKKFKSL